MLALDFGKNIIKRWNLHKVEFVVGVYDLCTWWWWLMDSWWWCLIVDVWCWFLHCFRMVECDMSCLCELNVISLFTVKIPWFKDDRAYVNANYWGFKIVLSMFIFGKFTHVCDTWGCDCDALKLCICESKWLGSGSFL